MPSRQGLHGWSLWGSKTRSLKWTWELIEDKGVLCGTNTQRCHAFFCLTFCCKKTVPRWWKTVGNLHRLRGLEAQWHHRGAAAPAAFTRSQIEQWKNHGLPGRLFKGNLFGDYNKSLGFLIGDNSWLVYNCGFFYGHKIYMWGFIWI